MVAPVSIDIANGALRRIGATTLSSWADTGNVRDAIESLFAMAVDLVVEEHPFYWTESKAQLVLDEVVTNLTEYQYAYDLPADFVAMRTLEPTGDWKLAGQHIYTDLEVDNDDNHPLLTYTARQTTTDGSGYPDIVAGALWPRTFAAAVERQLAIQAAQLMTAKKGLVPELQGEYGYYLERSISISERDRMPDPELPTVWGTP